MIKFVKLITLNRFKNHVFLRRSRFVEDTRAYFYFFFRFFVVFLYKRKKKKKPNPPSESLPMFNPLFPALDPFLIKVTNEPGEFCTNSSCFFLFFLFFKKKKT